eukprot:COSAG01_NODE_14038_length_1504_cov_1.123843_1_plen_229_part_10
MYGGVLLLRLMLLGATPSSRSGPPCTALLGGEDWYCSGEHMRIGQQHLINASVERFTVECVKGGASRCSSWQSATGVLQVRTQQVVVRFNTGGGQTGNLSSDCRRILWCGLPGGCAKNVWCEKDDCSPVFPPPPPPPRTGCAAGSRPPWNGGPCCNVTCVARASGNSCPCGPGCEECGAAYDVSAVPGYHLMDRSCAQNDPAAPFYDAQHGRYHVMYQKHAAAPQGKFG